MEYRDEIKFKYSGENYIFKTKPNPYNKYQMWWFEPQKAMYYGTIREAKNIAKNIKRRNIEKNNLDYS